MDRKWIDYASGWSSIQTSGDLSLAIFILLEPFGVSSTLNRNWIYTGGKPNPVPFDEKSLIDKSQCKKNSETNQYFFCLPPSGGKQLDWNSDTF